MATRIVVDEFRKLLSIPPKLAAEGDPELDLAALQQAGIVSFRPHAHEKEFTFDTPVDSVRAQKQASVEIDTREHKAVRRRRRTGAALLGTDTETSEGKADGVENQRSSSKRRINRQKKSRAKKHISKKLNYGIEKNAAEQPLTNIVSPRFIFDDGAVEDDLILPRDSEQREKFVKPKATADINAISPQRSFLQPLEKTIGKLSTAAANFITQHSPISSAVDKPPRQPSASPSNISSGAVTLISQLNFADPLKLQDGLTNLALHEQVDEVEQILKRLERNYAGSDAAITASANAPDDSPLSDLAQFRTRKTATDYTTVAADEASLRIRSLFTAVGVDSYQDLVEYIAKRIEQLENTSDRLAAEVGTVQTEVLSMRNVKNNLRDEVDLLQTRRTHLFDESVTRQKNLQERAHRDKDLLDNVKLENARVERVLNIDQLQIAYRRQAVLLRKRHNFRSAHYKQSQALRAADDTINAQSARSLTLEKAAKNRLVSVGEQLKSQHRRIHSFKHEITLLRQEVNAYVLDFDEQDMETPTTAGDNADEAQKASEPAALDFDEIGRMLERQDMKTFFMLRTEPMKMLDNIGEDMDRNAELIEQCTQKAAMSSRRVVMQLEQLASLYKHFQDYLRRHNIVHIPESIWLEYRRIERQPRATAHALQTAVHTYEALTYSIKCLVDCIQSSRDLVVDEQARHTGDQHRFQYIKRMADNGAKMFAYQERLAANTGLSPNYDKPFDATGNFSDGDHESDDESFFGHTSWDNEAIKLAELDSFYSIQHE